MIGVVSTSIASLLAGTQAPAAAAASGAEPSPDFDAMLAMLGIVSPADAPVDVPKGEAPAMTGEDAPPDDKNEAHTLIDAEPLTAALDAGIGAVLALLAQNGNQPPPTPAANGEAIAKTFAAAIAPVQVPDRTPLTTVAQEIEQAIPQGLQVALAAVTRALTAKQTPGEAAKTTADAGTAPLPPMDAGIAIQSFQTGEISPPAADTAAPAPAAVTSALAAAPPPSGAIPPPVAANDSAAPAPPAATPDLLITHHLQVEQDGQWLDQLARDIARSAAHDSQLRFKLNPEHLGSLTVEVSHRAEGAAVRFTADSEAARTLIVDAQPKLMAEARAQGLRIAEAHVDLGAQGNGGGQGQPQRWFEDQKPFLRTHGLNGEMPAESAGTPDDERYA